jgi:hypothetical protein
MSSISDFRSKRNNAASKTSTNNWEAMNSKLFEQRGFYFRLTNPDFCKKYQWSHAKSDNAFDVMMSNMDDQIDVIDFKCRVFSKDPMCDDDGIIPKKIYSLFPQTLFPSKELYQFRQNLKWIYCPASFDGELTFQVVMDERGLKFLTKESQN